MFGRDGDGKCLGASPTRRKMFGARANPSIAQPVDSPTRRKMFGDRQPVYRIGSI